MELWLYRGEKDWQFAYAARNAPISHDVSTEIQRDIGRFPAEGVERNRFGFSFSAGGSACSRTSPDSSKKTMLSSDFIHYLFFLLTPLISLLG